MWMDGRFRFGAYFDKDRITAYLAAGVVDYDDWAEELATFGAHQRQCLNATASPWTVTALIQDHPRICLPDPSSNVTPHPLHEGKMYLRKMNATRNVDGSHALDWGHSTFPHLLAKNGWNFAQLDTTRKVVFDLRKHHLARFFELDTKASDSIPSDQTRCLVPINSTLDEDGEVFQQGDDISILRQIQPSDLDADIWLIAKTHMASDWRLPSSERLLAADEALDYSSFLVNLTSTGVDAALGIHWRMEEADFQRADREADGGRSDEPELCAEMMFADLEAVRKELGVANWTVYVSTDHTDPSTLDLLGLAKSSSQGKPFSAGESYTVKVLRIEAWKRARAWKRLKRLLGGRMKTFYDVLTKDEITHPMPADLRVDRTAQNGTGIARDPGMLAIADKLLLRPAKRFLWGQPPCGRHFTHYAWEVSEWRARRGVQGDGTWGNVTAFLESREGWKSEAEVFETGKNSTRLFK
jgi:hypothetical protein